jgi:hypothetical protein
MFCPLTENSVTERDPSSQLSRHQLCGEPFSGPADDLLFARENGALGSERTCLQACPFGLTDIHWMEEQVAKQLMTNLQTKEKHAV